MWGKFVGEVWSTSQQDPVDDPVDFHKFHKSDRFDILYISVLTEERVEIHYKHKREDDPVSPNLNICFVTCFTTCWVHLRLYEALDLLQ